MKDSNRSIRPAPFPDVTAFRARARTDSNGVQAVAFENGNVGRTRFELRMEWASREDAVRSATWAFGCDRAAVGQRGALTGDFVVTDVFDRVRQRGILVVRHVDLIERRETLTPVQIDLGRDALPTAFATWRINARDYLELAAAYRILARQDSTETQRAAARGLVTAVKVKLGLDPAPTTTPGLGAGGIIA